MTQLPLFKRVIFVDWHGVLSDDPFWNSILCNEKHPLRSSLKSKLDEILSQKEIMHDWMRGIISSKDIISELDILTDRRFRHDFLAKRLEVDCAKMRVNVELFEALRRFRPIVLLVLATDNMDCFARTINRARVRQRQTKPKSTYLSEWASICDDVVCSSDVQALKAEDPACFFGSVLSKYNLHFENALLIDDRADNCDAFKRQGGNALQWEMRSSQTEDIIVSVQNWLRKLDTGTIRNSHII